MSASNDAGKTSVQYNFATTNIDGERIPLPETFPELDASNDIISLSEQSDWVPPLIVGVIILTASLLT